MAKSKLDKSKPFGEIWGLVEGLVGARYSQGTKLFNVDGEEIHDFAPVVEPEVQEAPADEPPALPGIPAKKK